MKSKYVPISFLVKLYLATHEFSLLRKVPSSFFMLSCDDCPHLPHDNLSWLALELKVPWLFLITFLVFHLDVILAVGPASYSGIPAFCSVMYFFLFWLVAIHLFFFIALMLDCRSLLCVSSGPISGGETTSSLSSSSYKSTSQSPSLSWW